MEKPNATTMAWFERAVPKDARARKGAMFGQPCAFVDGNMFFGTFAQSVVARVGEARAAALAGGPRRIFEPMGGRLWKEYIHMDTGAVSDADLATYAKDALEWTAANVPPKVAKAKKVEKG